MERDRPWSRRALALGALTTGTAAATALVGWELPVPLWSRLVAAVLAAGTVLAAAAAVRLLVAAVPGRGARGASALVAVVLLSGAVVAPGSDALEVGPTRLSAAEVADVLSTSVAPGGARVSGGDGSLVDRTSLGAEGRAFVDVSSEAGATRAYVGLGARADEGDRVLLALREWVRLGGLQRSVVLVAVPTGSGWVNAPGVRAAEAVADGDVASLVVQYADRASWLELALDRDRAARVTGSLVQALEDVTAQLPAERRPRIVLFGESLGGEAAAASTGPGVAACLATGRPAAALPWRAPTACTDVVNDDDPVASWTPRLLWTSEGMRGWLPVASFWRVSVELLSALDQGVGHGHRYEGSVRDEWTAIWPGTPA